MAGVCRATGPKQLQGLTRQQETQWRPQVSPGYPVPTHVHGMHTPADICAHTDTVQQEALLSFLPCEPASSYLTSNLEARGQRGMGRGGVEGGVAPERLLKAKKSQILSLALIQ